MEVITKTEFAKRCGVSNTAVFKWIKQNKNGINEYITPDGVKDSIFNVAPWDQIDKRPKIPSKNVQLRNDLETAKQNAENIQAELNRVQNELIEVQREKESHLQTINGLQEELSEARNQLNERDEKYARLQEDLAKAEQERDRVRGELTEARNQLNEAANEKKLLEKDVEHLKETISEREERLLEKDGYIAQLYGMVNRALPVARKTFTQRMKEFFKGKKTDDQN